MAPRWPTSGGRRYCRFVRAWKFGSCRQYRSPLPSHMAIQPPPLHFVGSSNLHAVAEESILLHQTPSEVGSETLQYERETLQHEEGNGAASEAHRQHGHGKIEDLCLAAYGDLIFVSVSDRFYNAGWVPVLCWVKYLGEEGESTPAAGVTFICSPWEMLRMLE
ncbi:uncharacterized protein LOC120661277 isoform X9 [Panicum virgatum]|uniref:uncharacterized protein LOC120661277 isoform X9 n=1 Tax=Panicum virgatum TaxID=38727 RepID=UPI0019D507F6|nr:uncharacterized protein LOC120661277 isoform X9 [Panicum virgatum]